MQFTEILNILEGKSINEIKNKAILFDAYGCKGFNNYLINQKMVYNSSTNLINYKQYINSFNTNSKNNYIKQ